MIITFDLSGRDRKQLVKAISEITGERAVYKFMPTCAFEIDFFTVTKEGDLTFSDNSDTEIVELVLSELAERGFTVIDDTDPEETATQPDTAEIAKVEELSKAAENQPTEATTEVATAEFAESSDIDRISVSISRQFFDDETLKKLDRTIESKCDLFKMAFKTDDLSYEITEDKATFPWFPMTGESGEGSAYTIFIYRLMKSLKESKRVNASKTQTDNPKFAMRVYLIRLGMVGDEFKSTRKILLRFLEGSSAFRKGAKQNEDTE